MDKYEIKLSDTIEYPWTECECISIGHVPKTVGTPDIYYMVSCCGKAKLIINAYYNYYPSYFKGAEVFGRYIFIGFCDLVYIIDMFNRNVDYFNLSGYFGYIYKYDHFALVASASDLLCFNDNGELAWLSENLGIDGVIVHDFDGKYIYGAGEWDPPGGWEDFKLIANSGMKIDEQ